MTRVKASFTHFLISVFVFSLFLSMVYFIWYAYPFNITQGVGEIVYIMAGVDVVLGPLLTLIVFKAGKKSLKFDLSVIALIQVAALVYGGYTIYSERPTYVVHAVDRFTVHGVNDVIQEQIEPEFEVGIFDKPLWVFAERATGEEANNILFEAVQGGKDIDQRPKFYREYDANRDTIFNNAYQNTDDLGLTKEQQNNSDLRFISIIGKKRDIIVLINNKAQVIDYVIKDPWPFMKREVSE